MTYNDLLSKRIEYYKSTGKYLTCYEQCKYLTKQKQKHLGLKEVYSASLQDVAVRVDLAFKNFYRKLKNNSGKAGFPRFKKFNRYDSMTYLANGCCLKIYENEIYLAKVGVVKIKKHNEIIGRIKSCIVRKNNTGKWFVCFICDNVPENKLPKTDKHIGIDLGVSNFATISNGKHISNPRFFKKDEKTLAKAQRKLSKIDKESKNYNRQKKIVARIHERIKNRRDNFVHQKSRMLINKYDTICVEDLKVNRMKEEGLYPRINKSIADVAWRDFINKLYYKAEEAGRKLVLVNPAYTTQICSKCFSRQKLILSERQYQCSSCGLSIDRDYNASLNILRLGLQSFG